MAVNNIKNQPQPMPLPGSAGSIATGDAGKTERADGGARTERVAQKQAANAYGKVANSPTVRDAANVQISQKAREMSLAKRVADETPDVREDKIARFKDLIARGEYKPDAGKIADGILGEAIRDELSKTPDIALE